PTNASGATSDSPCCTAPTRRPIATANAAGRTPRRTRRIHQIAARPGAALGKTAKNCHSLRAVSRGSTRRILPDLLTTYERRRICTMIERTMTRMTTGIFHESSWVKTVRQWRHTFSALGVILLQTEQTRRGADGLRPQTPQVTGVACGFPQYGQAQLSGRPS